MKIITALLPLVSSVGAQEYLRSRNIDETRWPMSRNLADDTNSTASNDAFYTLFFDDESDDNDMMTNKNHTISNTRTRSTSCSSDQRQVMIRIKTDNSGWETSWILKGNGVRKRSPSYESNRVYTQRYCLGEGQYRFIIKDKMKDGFNSGGYYKVFVQEGQAYRVVVAGSEFAFKKAHLFDIGYNAQGKEGADRDGLEDEENKSETGPSMTDRDALYLLAHNKRRKEWHERYNKQYIPLKWSQGLKDSSMEYAIKLLDTCTTGQTPHHDPNNVYGENLARNKGSGSWGQLYSPDKILNRFVEREVGLPWARNGHLTNALWRATKYVGCAEAEKSYPITNTRGTPITNTCRVQVCRYAKPGNCAMSKFKINGKVDWETAMMQDDSPCEPSCPPEGCF